MAHRSIRNCAFAVLVLLGTTVSVRAQTVLRWNFREGATYRNRAVLRMHIELKGPKGSAELDMEQTLFVTQRIRSVAPDGSAELAVVFDRIIMQIESPEGEVVYDSAKGEMPADALLQQQVAALNALLGKTVIDKVDSRGRVLERKPPEELRRLLQQDPVLRHVVDQLLAPQTAAGRGWPSLPVFPKRAVKAGDSWSVPPLKMAFPFATFEITPTFTYLGKVRTERGTFHKIETEARLSSTPAGDARFPLAIKSYSGKGQIYIDEQLTHVARSHGRAVFEFAIGPEEQQILQRTTMDALVESVPDRSSAE